MILTKGNRVERGRRWRGGIYKNGLNVRTSQLPSLSLKFEHGYRGSGDPCISHHGDIYMSLASFMPRSSYSSVCNLHDKSIRCFAFRVLFYKFSLPWNQNPVDPLSPSSAFLTPSSSPCNPPTAKCLFD